MAKSINIPINNPGDYALFREASKAWISRVNPVANPDRALAAWILTIAHEAAAKELNK